MKDRTLRKLAWVALVTPSSAAMWLLIGLLPGPTWLHALLSVLVSGVYGVIFAMCMLNSVPATKQAVVTKKTKAANDNKPSWWSKLGLAG